jgi:hypothetical protein
MKTKLALSQRAARLLSLASFTTFYVAQLATLHAQGTAFTYQGRLNDGANPANGTYDLRFQLNDAATGGNNRGQPLTNSAVTVSNGLFTTTLDFGFGVLTGGPRWLQIGVRTNSGSGFVFLAPRTALSPAPYAVYAANAAQAGTISGTVPASGLNGLYLNPVNFSNPGNSFAGNGAGLTNVNGAWFVNGTNLFYNAGNVGIGTTTPGSALQVNGTVTATSFAGDAAGLTNISLALISGGAFSSAGNGTFAPAGSPGVGTNPHSVAAADVNGDGKVDLISANLGNNTLTVLTNNGIGGFVVSASPGVGSSPRSVVAADMNGDGKVDLISANAGANTLTVLTNSGTGGFLLAASPTVGNAPYAVVAADVNGDGRMDLASANAGANTLTVLMNNGSGGFVAAASPGTGSSPLAVVAEDVNGDGRVDLIAANGNAAALTVLTNNGGGSFVLASSPAVDCVSASLTAADVNGDGKVDLIHGNGYACASLSILTNNGAGVFSTSSAPSLGSYPYAVRAADVNGDGKVDLITVADTPNRLTVLTNNGSGGFALSAYLAVGAGPRSLVAADANGDGRPDLITANYTAGTLTVLHNASTFIGAFAGDGAGLTSLNAASLTGAVPGAALTSVPAGSLTGTILDARLSANVALLNAGQTFAGVNRFNNSVGIGIAPQSTLHVNGTARIQGADNWDVNNTEGDFRVGNDTQRFKIGVATGGGGAGDVWMRAQGGTARVFLKPPGGTYIYSNEGQTAGVSLAGNGTAWAVISDRNAKRDFAPGDSVAILDKLAALPITQWHYNWETPDVTPHIGPMAQDFKAAFYPGSDDKSITTQEADGVALAAIQGLNQKLEETRAENFELRARLERLERLLSKQGE